MRSRCPGISSRPLIVIHGGSAGPPEAPDRGYEDQAVIDNPAPSRHLKDEYSQLRGPFINYSDLKGRSARSAYRPGEGGVGMGVVVSGRSVRSTNRRREYSSQSIMTLIL